MENLEGSGGLARLERRASTTRRHVKARNSREATLVLVEVHSPDREHSQITSSGGKKAEIAQMELLSPEKQRPIVVKHSLLGK